MARKSSKKKKTKAAKRAPKAVAKKRVKKVTKKSAKKAAKKSVRKVARKAAKKPAETAVRKAPKKARAKVVSPPKPVEAATAITKAARNAAAALAPTKPAASRENMFYITTAIAYPNGQPHIGHAYEAIATDALARFARLDGKDVFFLTGTDEHGLKMVQTAQAEGLPVAELAARNAGRFRAMDERLNVSFDRYIRTTEAQHHRSSQMIWNRMQQNGDIYIDTYSGWYSVRDEAYYAEDETVVGEDNVRRGGQGTPVEFAVDRQRQFVD